MSVEPEGISEREGEIWTSRRFVRQDSHAGRALDQRDGSSAQRSRTMRMK